MFKLFKKDKPSIDAITIPNFGWDLGFQDASIKQWVNPEQTMALSVNFFNKAPDLPTIKDIDLIRSYYRGQLVQANGGIIQVDFIKLNGYDTIKTIFKIRQEEGGVTYLTSLTIPFKSCSYVIKIQAIETGTTGLRESVVGDKLLKENIISLGESGYNGWNADPYLSGFKDGYLMNLAEHLDHDKDFLVHHLTLSRKLIQTIEDEIEFNQKLKAIDKFDK